MYDALGNELHVFDVIHFGTQIGIVLGIKEGPNGRGGTTMKMRVLSRGTSINHPRYGEGHTMYERVSYLNDAHESAVKLHPDYFTDSIRKFVQDAKDKHGKEYGR